MPIFKLGLTYVFAVIMVLGGIMHFWKPYIYYGFLFDFLPKKIINYFGGALEIAIGIGLFIPQYRSVAAGALFLLMLAFLPLHLMDVFKDKPAIGSVRVAQFRLPIQFVLILWAWFIYKK